MEEDVPETAERKVPKLLYLVYLVLIVGGIWGFISYWNGSHGWLDRGSWRQLQEAAKTKFI